MTASFLRPQRCETCQHAEHILVDGSLQCRLNPPMPMLVQKGRETSIASLVTVVDPAYWCSHYKPPLVIPKEVFPK